MGSVTIPATDVKIGDFISHFGLVADVVSFDKKVANTKKPNDRVEKRASKDRIAEIEQENSEMAVSAGIVIRSNLGNRKTLLPSEVIKVMRK